MRLQIVTRAHGFFADGVESREPFFAVVGRVFEQRESGGRHVVCDVPKMPFAAFPDGREIRRFLAHVVA